MRTILPQVQLGEYADVHLNAYPDRVLKARIDNIGADPGSQYSHGESPAGCGESGLDAARHVRHGHLPRQGDGNTRHGAGYARFCTCMIATGSYAPRGDGTFRRLEVVAGNMLPGNMQEIVSGLKPGDTGG